MWHWYTSTWQLRRLRSLLKILRMLMIVHPLGMMTMYSRHLGFEPRSDKESPEMEIVQEKEEETTKDKEVEPDKDTPMVDVTNIVPPINVDDEEDEIMMRKGYAIRTSSDQLVDNLHDVMMENCTSLVERESNGSKLRGKFLHKFEDRSCADPLLQQQDIAIWLTLQMNFEKTQCKRAEDIGVRKHRYLEINRSGQVKYVTKTSGNELSLTIDDAKLKKMADEMLRQRCTSGDELQDCGRRAIMIALVSINRGQITRTSIRNDFEDLYLLIVNNNGPDMLIMIAMVSISVHQEFSDMGKRIEEYDVFSIVYEPVHGIIYTNSKKEKRGDENIQDNKFCDETL
ncbi:hypothetical protein Tco_0020167 [Tanacetum coccineum]